MDEHMMTDEEWKVVFGRTGNHVDGVDHVCEYSVGAAALWGLVPPAGEQTSGDAASGNKGQRRAFRDPTNCPPSSHFISTDE